MSDLTKFLKKNKKVKENAFYAATKSLTDDNGKPLLWEIRPLSTKDNETIRDECTYEVPVKGKPNVYRPKINTGKFGSKIIASSVVFPNLYSAELQDSYGVKSPEELIVEMIDDPSEYNDFVSFIQRYNGFNETMEEKVEEAKNE